MRRFALRSGDRDTLLWVVAGAVLTPAAMTPRTWTPPTSSTRGVRVYFFDENENAMEQIGPDIRYLKQVVI